MLLYPSTEHAIDIKVERCVWYGIDCAVLGGGGRPLFRSCVLGIAYQGARGWQTELLNISAEERLNNV